MAEPCPPLASDPRPHPPIDLQACPIATLAESYEASKAEVDRRSRIYFEAKDRLRSLSRVLVRRIAADHPDGLRVGRFSYKIQPDGKGLLRAEIPPAIGQETRP